MKISVTFMSVRNEQMKKIPPFISLLLLSAFSFILIPKEAIHELCAHTDTEHRCDVFSDGPVLDNKHLHCESLELSAPAVILTEKEALRYDERVVAKIFCSLPVLSIHGFLFSVHLRGPPVFQII